MPQNYNLKTFLRKASDELLKRYFAEKGLAGQIDWSSDAGDKVDSVFEVIISAPEGVHEDNRAHH
jgi:hypothetical protein